MLIQMTEKFRINVPKFDAQHLRLFSIFNRLNDSIQKGAGSGSLENTMAEFVEYTDTHFKDEEVVMDQYNFPLLGLHKMEHMMFYNEVKRLHVNMLVGKAVITCDVVMLLLSWFKDHIQHSDRKYASHMLEAAGMGHKMNSASKGLNV